MLICQDVLTFRDHFWCLLFRKKCPESLRYPHLNFSHSMLSSFHIFICIPLGSFCNLISVAKEKTNNYKTTSENQNKLTDICRCLLRDDKLRWSTSQLLEHPFILEPIPALLPHSQQPAQPRHKGKLLRKTPFKLCLKYSRLSGCPRHHTLKESLDFCKNRGFTLFVHQVIMQTLLFTFIMNI